MLDRFLVKNFKAFKEADITIRPLTVLVGSNNSGKSSLIQAINLIHQTLLRNPNNYIFNINTSDGSDGQTIDVGTFTEIVNHSSIDKKIEFRLFFAENNIEFSLKFDGETNVYVSDFFFNNGDFRYSLKDLSINDYNKKDFSINNMDKLHIELSRHFDDKDIINIETNPRVHREGFFFHIASVAPKEDSLKSYFKERISEQSKEELIKLKGGDEFAINRLISELVNSFDRCNRIALSSYDTLQKIKTDFSNIKYVGPIRKPAERFYSIGSYNDLGFNGEHAIQLLYLDPKLRNKVEQCLFNMGLAEKIYIDTKNDNQSSFELKIKTISSEREVNFKDIGCGISQILPILVQSLITKNESLVILEQPEVYLHPIIQAELADFFAAIATKDHRFLIETHSDYFIERLRYQVANGALQSKDLYIYSIEQNPDTKNSEVTRIEINSKGQYLNSPRSFITNFRLKETKNMSDLLLKNLTKNF